MIQRDGSPKQDRSIGWSKSSQDLVLGGTQFRFIWNHQVIMIEDCQETRDATLLGTPFVISLCPRGQFHHVVMQAIWNHGKSWCWRSKDSCGQGLTGRCQKRNAQVEKKGMMLSSFNESPFSGFGHHFTWTLYLHWDGITKKIYIYISILHFACPTKILWWCQPCKDAWVHYSFAEPGRQECWWKWTTFWHFCHLRYIFLLFYFHLRMISHWYTSLIQDSSFDAAWPGGSGFGEFYDRLLDALRRPTKPKTKRDSPDRWLWLSPAWIASSSTSVPPRLGWKNAAKKRWIFKLRLLDCESLRCMDLLYGIWVLDFGIQDSRWPQVSAFSSHLNASLEPLRLEIKFHIASMTSIF